MFQIIDPAKQQFHRPSINSLLRFLKVKENFDLSLENKKKASFILSADSAQRIYGGAILFPSKPENLSFYRQSWNTKIFLILHEALPLLKHEQERLTSPFYKGLCDTLLNFGIEKGIDHFTFEPSSLYEPHTHLRRVAW